MYVVIKREVEHSNTELPGCRGTKKDESCMGLFKDFRTAQREIAACLFDELRYCISANNGNISVGGTADWKTDRVNGDMHIFEISIANTDYTFKAFFIDEVEDKEDDGNV